MLAELDEIHLIDVGLAQKSNIAGYTGDLAFGTGYTGDACAYRVDCAAPFLLQPIVPDGRAYRRPRPMLTRTSSGLRTVRTGYALCVPEAQGSSTYCTYRRTPTSLGRAVRTMCRGATGRGCSWARRPS